MARIGCSVTVEDLLLWVARGVTVAGLWTLFLTAFDLLPERHVFGWVAWSAMVLVALSLWIGLA